MYYKLLCFRIDVNNYFLNKLYLALPFNNCKYKKKCSCIIIMAAIRQTHTSLEGKYIKTISCFIVLNSQAHMTIMVSIVELKYFPFHEHRVLTLLFSRTTGNSEFFLSPLWFELTRFKCKYNLPYCSC